MMIELNIKIKNALVKMDFIRRYEELSAHFIVYLRRLIDINYRIKKPVFGTYEDLEDIWKTAFEMYEDFKTAFM